MIYIILLGPGAIAAMLLLGWVVLSLLYKGSVDVGATLLEWLPSICTILCGILLVASIVSALRRRNFLRGLLMLISWGKCICLSGVAAYTLLTVIQAAGNVFMAIFVVPITLAVICFPVALDIKFTARAWDAVGGYGSLRPVVVELAIFAVIFAAICGVGLLAQ